MSVFRVVIVDPNAHRRTDIAVGLGRRAAVQLLGTPAEARTALAEHAPDAVVISLRQVEAHGLELARQLKALAPKVWIMVYGADAGLAEKRKEIKEKLGIAVYEPRDLSGFEIAARVLASRPGATRNLGDADVQAGIAKLEWSIGWERLRNALIRHRDLLPTRERAANGPISLPEALNRPVSLPNLHVLFAVLLGRAPGREAA